MVQRNTSLHRNGKNGGQFLDKAQNKTLAESPKSSIQLHLFEVFEPGRYIYQGKVSLIEKPYQAMQRDEGGLRRKVWIFPLALQHNQITISDKEYNAYTAIQEKKANSLNETELKARAKEHLSKSPPKEPSTITHFLEILLLQNTQKQERKEYANSVSSLRLLWMKMENPI